MPTRYQALSSYLDILKSFILSLPATNASAISNFLHHAKLEYTTVFNIHMHLELDGKFKEYYCDAYIEDKVSWYRLIIVYKHDQHLPESFDSRYDTFIIEAPGSITVAGITEQFSYKATIFPLPVPQDMPS